jgi:tetratricopeptide (TPR) repeat protein
VSGREALESPAGTRWLGVALVVLAALAASAAGLLNEFAQDDLGLIRENTRIHDLGNWRTIVSSPWWPPPWHVELYRPLTSLLHAVQYAVGGGSPLPFRITSYLLYAGTALAVLSLAARLVPRSIAIAVALLFAAHPVHVEAVAPAVGQGELLVALLAAVITARYVERRRNDDGALSARDWSVLGLLYLTASLAKEQGLLIPAMLICAEIFLLPRPGRQRARGLAAGYAVLAAIAVGMVFLRRTVLGGEFAGTFTAEALEGLSAGGRALTMLQVVPQWARLLLWPAHLQADYSPQEIVASTGLGPVELFGAALLLGALALAWLARKRAPVVSFGLAWMAVALLPVSNVLLPTAVVLAERTLFLPSVGFVLVVGGLAASVKSRLERRPAWGRRAAQVACGVLVVAGVARSAERHRVWKNDDTFAFRSSADAPRSYRMQQAFAQLLFKLDYRNEAVAVYQEAIMLAPPRHVWRLRNNLASLFLEMGEAGRALEHLRESLRVDPTQDETRQYLTLAYLALGAYADAARQADTALIRGGAPQTFGTLRALADSATMAGAPAGSIRIRIHLPTGAGPSSQ